MAESSKALELVTRDDSPGWSHDSDPVAQHEAKAHNFPTAYFPHLGTTNAQVHVYGY